jgi:hypothetical protein
MKRYIALLTLALLFIASPAWAYTSGAHGTLKMNDMDLVTVNSVLIVNGTILTGDVTSMQAKDGVCLEVKETGKFIYNGTFTGVTKPPAEMELGGWYNGSAAHEVELLARHDDLTLDDVIATTKDFEHTGTTQADWHYELLTPRASYVDGSNETLLQIYHVSNDVATHNMCVDYWAIHLATLEMTLANTFYIITGLDEGGSKNVTLDGSSGTITIVEPGDYVVSLTISYTGTGNTDTHIHVFNNGTALDNFGVNNYVRANALADSGSYSDVITLENGDVLDVRGRADTAGGYISVKHLNFSVRKVN